MRQVLTILAVEDLAAMAAFYERALAVRRSVDAASYVELPLPGGTRLGLYERVGFGRNTGRAPFLPPRGELRPVELYFHADEPIADAVTRITAAGARELSALARRDWGDDAAYFADPEGNVLVVAAPST